MKQPWVPDLSLTPGPKYLAIAEAIGDAIGRGDLRAGDRLPPQRDLAQTLGVDLTTVTKAYDRARARGMIAARGRAGSFVLEPQEIAAGPPPIDTGMNMPPEVSGGSLAAAWERTTSALLRAPGSLGRMHYQPAGGLAADRCAAIPLLASFGLHHDAEDRILVAPGAQAALHAIVGAALRPGDVVACAAMIYPGFLSLARSHGLQLAPLDSLDADALAALCARRPVRALYLVPTNDNPTTRTLTPTERAALAQVCLRHDVLLIEDDAYGQLEPEPLPAAASHMPGQAWHITSMSKSITPALRVAYVHAPSIRDALTVATSLHQTSVMPPPLNLAMLSAWLQDGTYARLVEETRGEAAARLRLAADILPAGSHAASPHGYHLWVPLPADTDQARLADAVRGTGLTTIAADSFAVVPGQARALRVSLGGPIGRDQLVRALHVLDAQLTAGAPLAPLI